MGSKGDMATQFSKLTQAEIDRLCLYYGIGAELKIELPNPSTPISSRPKGKIALYI